MVSKKTLGIPMDAPTSGPRVLTEVEQIREKVLATLAELGDLTVGDDEIAFEGKKFVLPAQFATDIPGAVRYLMELQKQAEAMFEFSRTFDYRPYDGAAAFQRAMARVFGTSGTGRTLHTIFGDIRPEYRSVVVGPDGESIQVPWGQIHLSPLEATFTVHGARSPEKGMISRLAVEAPKKYRSHVEAFFAVVEEELRTNSIYRGRAFTGGEEPEFMDTRTVDPAQVVYSQDVIDQLETELFAPILYAETMREHGQTLKRAVLVEGPYGTGKTLAGRLTARVATSQGWTFIVARPGKDDIGEVLNTAKLYAPAVVWFEDVDVVAEGEDRESVARLLDILDGITNKETPILAAFTTNFVEKIHKGVLRPGRIDAVIHIGGLDAEGVQKLIRAKIPAEFLADQGEGVDWATVAAAHEDYLPAFVAESAGRAFRRSAARNQGVPDVITTEDLVYAANSLRAQHTLMNDADEGRTPDPIAEVLHRELRQAMDKSELLDGDGDLVAVMNVSKN